MNNLKMEIFCQLEEERKITERNNKAKAYSAKAKKEKAKAKLALSIIGGAFLSLPLFYGMLFVVTLV